METGACPRLSRRDSGRGARIGKFDRFFNRLGRSRGRHFDFNQFLGHRSWLGYKRNFLFHRIKRNFGRRNNLRFRQFLGVLCLNRLQLFFRQLRSFCGYKFALIQFYLRNGPKRIIGFNGLVLGQILLCDLIVQVFRASQNDEGEGINGDSQEDRAP